LVRLIRRAIPHAEQLCEIYLKERAAKMSTVRWPDIRDKHIEAISREDVERGTSRPISQVRAHRLADKRKRRGLTSAKSPIRGG
jgi:hypothetical protein